MLSNTVLLKQYDQGYGHEIEGFYAAALKVVFQVSASNTLEIARDANGKELLIRKPGGGFYKETTDDLKRRFPEAFDQNAKAKKEYNKCHVWSARILLASAYSFVGMSLQDGMRELISQGTANMTNKNSIAAFQKMAQQFTANPS